jgi:hypothetical protein
MSRILRLTLGLIILSFFAYSCATTSGNTLQKASSIEAGTATREKAQGHPAPAPVTKKGLTIQTTPDDASVYINGVYQGTTPLVIGDLIKGSYLLTLRKEGYYDVVTWIDFPGDSLLFQATLDLITGFLQLSVTPADSVIGVGGTRVYPGLLELPVGSYHVTVRAFGYGEQDFDVAVLAKAVTPLEIVLAEVPFSIMYLSSAKNVVNPDNPGILGTVSIRFGVSGPGTGQITVSDSESRVFFTDSVGPFTTWDYTYTWSARDTSGGEIPDGQYLITLSGEGRGGQASDSRDVGVRFDRSVRESMRSVWSGGAGLLYVSSTDIMPQQSFQVSFLGAATVTPSLVRVPVSAAVRFGIGGLLEVDAEASAVFSGASAPFGASAAVRYPLLRTKAPVGFGVALEGKASVQYNPSASGVLTTDTLSNFTGLVFGVPAQFSAGPVSFLAEPQIIATLWHPYDAGTPPEAGFASWLYLRGGVMLDLGPVSGGVSMAARTASFTDGVFSFALPFQAAAEVHWLLPSSHFMLSGLLIGEIDDLSNFYLAGGGGFGFIY